METNAVITYNCPAVSSILYILHAHFSSPNENACHLFSAAKGCLIIFYKNSADAFFRATLIRDKTTCWTVFMAWKNLKQRSLADSMLIDHNALNRSKSINKAVICYNIGNKLKHQGNFDEAITAYKTAIHHHPLFTQAWFNMGNTQFDHGELNASITSYKKLLTLTPNHAKTLHNLGIAYYHNANASDAIVCYKNAMHIDSKLPGLYYNFGLVLHDIGALKAATKYYKKALIVKPNSPEVYNNIGNALQALNDLTGAQKAYETAISLKPSYFKAVTNKAYLMLKKGDLKDGFEMMEFRKQNTKKSPPAINVALYQGQSLFGKHLLICGEQGVGDEVMFASILQDLRKHGAIITLVCDARLVDLFNRSFEFLTAVPKTHKGVYEDVTTPFDYWMLIGSLAMFYRNDINKFRKNTPYLNADDDQIEKWKKRFNELEQPINIGISWSGGAKNKTKRLRSLRLEQLTPILKLASERANIINLQYGDHKDEIESFEKQANIVIHDWTDADPLKNLDNFSAQIKALDLVISIDNTTVHFAGGLGVKTLIMLPFDSNWRWGREEQCSYWYPHTIEIFRQPVNGDWVPVIEKISDCVFSKMEERTNAYKQIPHGDL